MALAALEAISRLCADPHGANRAWKARTGGKVVGYLGRDVPPELIAAAGMLPVEVFGAQGSEGDAIAPYLPASFVEPALRSIASRLIDGTYDYLDYLVVSPKPAVNITLFEFQREAGRIFGDIGFPETYFLDFFHSPRLTASLFNRDSLRRLQRQLESWSNREITEGALRQSIITYNARRRSLADITALVGGDRPRLSGWQALSVAGAMAAAPFEDVAPLLDALLDGRRDLPEIGGLPVIYSGTATTGVEPYRAIEAGGVRIVADDQDCGITAFQCLASERVDPIDALADRAQLHLPDALRQQAQSRAVHLADLARSSGARAVLFHILAIDHASMLDYPRVRDGLEAAGIATAEYGPRAYHDINFKSLTMRTADFVAGMPRGLAA